MNRSESKYFNTALLMDQALVELLKEKDFEFITIKEICAKAGVNRTTFYLHYETIADLVNETLELTMKQFQESFSVKPKEFVPNIKNAPLQDLVLITREYLHPYLTFIQEHQPLYKAAFTNPATFDTNGHMENVYRYVLLPILERFHVPEEKRVYMMDFFIYGCMAIIRRWVANGCREPIEQIESLVIRCIRPESDRKEKPGRAENERKD
ncbi:MAG: TetR/AcrR family transcriptional regulator [Bulleidia sp.]|nr:TetR/AcrR family transcriptional regulator [Bulleidia sp.]